MVMVMIIRSQDKDLWVIRRGGQSTDIFYIRNINGSWNHIRGIEGYFIRAGIIKLVMGGRFKAGLPQSAVNGLFKQ